MSDLLLPAAGQDADDVSSGCAERFSDERFIGRSCGEIIEHGVADVAAVNTELVIERLLEWQDDHHARDAPGDLPNSARTPCPDLRADVVADRNLPLLGKGGELEIELRVVNWHDDIRRLAVEFTDCHAIGVRPVGRVAKSVAKPHASVPDCIGNDAHTGITHARPAKSAEADIRNPFSQGACQSLAEPVAGMLAR